MGFPSNINPIRFPFTGAHLRLLAQKSSLPRSTRYRHASLLRDAGFPSNGTEDFHPFVAASKKAIAERPDIESILDTPSRLAALAALPAHPALPPLHVIAGMSLRSWGTAIRHLHQMNVVLRPDGKRGNLELNQNLIAMARLVLEYRRLHERAPQGLVANPHEATLQTIHQRGVETAWVVSGSELGPIGQPVGPSSKLEPFKAIQSSNHYTYFGKRKLTRWDHVFLYLNSQRDEFNNALHRLDAPEEQGPPGLQTARGGLPAEPPFRAQALFYALTSPDLFEDRNFLKWATFYHQSALVRRLTGRAQGAAMERGIPPSFKSEVNRLRNEFGLEEGWLAV